MKAKYTNWQLQFFIAIMTSWQAFNLFYIKQFNKRMFDQYIGRFFPVFRSKTKKIKKANPNTHNKDLIYLLTNISNFLINNCCSNPSIQIWENPTNIYFDGHILREIASQYYNNRLNNRARNCILDLHFISKLGYIDKCLELSSDDMCNNVRNFHNSFDVGDKYKITKIVLHRSRYGHEEVHDFLIYLFKTYASKYNPSLFISNVNKMNIGLEFEYDCDHLMPLNTMTTFDSPHLVELSSGYDGHNDENTRDLKYTVLKYAFYKSSPNRLNEDRLRLNGYKGLKSLHKYLTYLNENGKISKNSSIHVHIDCKYDNTYSSMSMGENNPLIKYLCKVKNPSLLKIIYISDEDKFGFNLNKYMSRSTAISMITGLIKKNDLKTLEFRSFKTSFQYEDIVMYILVASYITRCIKKNTEIREEIIKTIIKANKIVKKNKKSSTDI